MTVTYDITTIVGQIRLLTGDTNIIPITNAVFTDEELTFFYTQAGSDVYIAAALACLAWANKYQANADSEHIGDYSYTQSIVDKLKGMAATFMSTSSNIPVMDWASFNMTGVENTEDI
jgi:hypothetical protein